MIIDRLTAAGVMDLGSLYEPPFTSIHHEGLDGAFEDGDADAIVSLLGEINRRAAAWV
jgi:type I restriction enzyme R subunit